MPSSHEAKTDVLLATGDPAHDRRKRGLCDEGEKRLPNSHLPWAVEATTATQATRLKTHAKWGHHHALSCWTWENYRMAYHHLLWIEGLKGSAYRQILVLQHLLLLGRWTEQKEDKKPEKRVCNYMVKRIPRMSTKGSHRTSATTRHMPRVKENR